LCVKSKLERDIARELQGEGERQREIQKINNKKLKKESEIQDF